MTTKSSDALSGGLIGKYFPQQEINHSENDANTKQLGSGVVERAETIYKQTKAVRNLISNVKDNPMRFGTSVVALAGGLSNLYAGDLVSGGIATLVGAKELYNQCQNGDGSTLDSLLNDINAGADMIRVLEEGQQKSIDVIQENLNLVHGDVKALYTKLKAIEELNLETLQTLESDKKEAHEKGLEAEEAYGKALELFTLAKTSFGESKKVYDKCTGYFETIQEIAEDEEDKRKLSDKMHSIVKAAKTASKKSREGKQSLDAAEMRFSAAMEALTHASRLKDESFEMIVRTLQKAKDRTQANVEIAQHKDIQDRIEKKVEETQEELEEMKKRSEGIMGLLDEMSEEVKLAKEEAAKKLDPSDVIVGVGTGIALSPTGVLTALTAGVSAAYAWHNATAIVDTTKKVYEFVSGNTTKVVVAAMEEGEAIRTKFQEHSTGIWGKYVKKRQSHTVGTLDVNLGKELPMRLTYDLNNERYPIAKEDLCTLYREMFENLKEKTLKPEKCLQVLDGLEKWTDKRGGLHKKFEGLIKPKQRAYCLVESLRGYCEKLTAASAA